MVSGEGWRYSSFLKYTVISLVTRARTAETLGQLGHASGAPSAVDRVPGPGG